MTIDIDQIEAAALAAPTTKPVPESICSNYDPVEARVEGEAEGWNECHAAMTAAANPAVVLELISEIRRLSGIVEQLGAPDKVMLTGMHPHEHGGFFLGLEGGACQFLAASFADQFRGSKATNYLELTFETRDPELGGLIVTIQRRAGKTPHQLRAEAERERDALSEATVTVYGPHGGDGADHPASAAVAHQVKMLRDERDVLMREIADLKAGAVNPRQ